MRRAALALSSGVLVALSLPPWGFWPLAFVGIALFECTLGTDATARQRAARGWLFGAGWMFPGMGWMWFLTAPGYVVVGAMFAGLHALAAVVAPTGRWRVFGRPAAHTAVEALRLFMPFGGVPLATVALGQAGGPLLGVARVGGVILLTWVVFQIGIALGALAETRRAGRLELAALGAAATVVVLAVVAPTGYATGRTLRVTLVQGGGPQGTLAINTNPRDVVERHLAATRTIERPAAAGAARTRGRRRRIPRSVRSGLIALLVVAAAIGAFFALYRPTHVIGDYASMPAAEVRDLLKHNGYSVTENGEYSETVERDTIISQDPAAGTSLKEGRTVTLTVSLGPPPVPVPTDLAGRTVDQAASALTAASLRLGTLIDGYDETIAKGIVLSLADGTPAELPKGSPVDLVVSAGPKPRIVPDGLVGQPVDAVTTQLTALGLVVARNDAYSDTVAEGTVLSVTPPSGAAVPKGGTVTVSASKGKRPIAIPADIVGKSVTAATEELQALGLVVSGVQGSPTGRVSGSNPAVGALVKPGSSVLLLTR